MPGGAYRAARLDSREVRELYPVVLLLEATAVRDGPDPGEDTIAALRAANERLKASSDAGAASDADDEFHRALTAGCGNERLLEMLDPVRRALLDYERVYMSTPERRARSAAQHEAIIAALEARDRGRAADLVRDNFTSALPDLTAELDARGENRVGLSHGATQTRHRQRPPRHARARRSARPTTRPSATKPRPTKPRPTTTTRATTTRTSRRA